MVPFLSLLTVCVVGVFLLSGFVDIHADVASALMVTFMLEEHFIREDPVLNLSSERLF